jgi:hypothetical protein
MTVFAVAYVILTTLRLVMLRGDLKIAEQQKQVTSELVISNESVRESHKAFLARLSSNVTSSDKWFEKTEEQIATMLGEAQDRETRFADVLQRAEALLDKLENSKS